MIKTLASNTWSRLRATGERGAGLAEYALLLFVVVVAATTVMAAFGDDIVAMFTEASDALPVDGGTPTTVAP